MPFDNDDAADWAALFDGVDLDGGRQVLLDALAVHDVDYLEAPEGSIAIAAAQVVAWLASPSETDDSAYAESVMTWVATSGATADAALIDQARRALERVRAEGSEIAELWAEADDDEWGRALDDVLAQLNGGAA